MVLAWENLQWGFCDVSCCSLFIAVFVTLVVVLHSLLFDVIPHPFVSYRQSFYTHFILSARFIAEWFTTLSFFYSFSARATVLMRHFLPMGVFYLTLLPHIFDTTCFFQSLPGSRQFFLEVFRAADPRNKDRLISLFDSQQTTVLIFRRIRI